MKIVSDEALRLYNAKEFARRKISLFILSFPTKDKLYVLENVILRIKSFLILDEVVLRQHSKVEVNRIYVTRRTIEEVLDDIDQNDGESWRDEPDDNSDNKMFLLFMKRPGIGFEEEKCEDLSHEGWKEYKARFLLNFLEGYHVYDTYYYNLTQCIEMSRTKEISTEEIRIYDHLTRIPDAEVITSIGGLGDDFIIFSIVYEFVKRKKKAIEPYMFPYPLKP